MKIVFNVIPQSVGKEDGQEKPQIFGLNHLESGIGCPNFIPAIALSIELSCGT